VCATLPAQLTRMKQERKEKLQADYKPGGQRDAGQVLANSAGGAIAALAGTAAVARGDTVLASAAGAAFLVRAHGAPGCKNRGSSLQTSTLPGTMQ
jgi:uncharacterized membrane protein